MIWYPYQQMKTMGAPYEIIDASGVYLYTREQKLIDSVSSWWSVIHGYKHPELNQYVSHTPSPMVMLGRYIKDRDPLARVVFIGPCVAKKREFHLGRTRSSVDLVITFEELYSMLAAKDIDVSKMPEATLDHASGFGRSFAHSGGVAAAVAEGLKEHGVSQEQFKLNAVSCSGIPQCKVELLKFAKGIGGVNFLEGMACEGGCVQGPGILVRSPRNQADVQKHAREAEGRTILDAVGKGQKEQK